MTFWSFRSRKSSSESPAANSGVYELDELAPQLESELTNDAIANSGYSRPVTSAHPRPNGAGSTRLTLQPSHIIFHVGSREIPTGGRLSESTRDQLRDLCTRLVGGDERARVISVVSDAEASDAKSLVTAQLAAMLGAEYGPRVLAMEAHPSAPALHRALGFCPPRGYGLWEQLQRMENQRVGRVSIVQLDQRLAALVATEVLQAPPEWPDSFEAVLTQLRREHEYVVLDGPVIQSSADGAHLQTIDGVVFVKSARTKLTQTLHTAAQCLPRNALIRIVEVEGSGGLHRAEPSWRARTLGR